MNVERLAMTVCALIGAVVLFLFGRHVWHAGAEQTEPSGIIVRSEVLTIYTPKALIDFATAHPEITTNDELVRLIRQAKLNVWFATITRHHQTNGLTADISQAFRVGERPECFDMVQTVLLTLAGNRPAHDPVSYTDAEIEVFEDAMMEMIPVEGLRELLQR
jgi:hypothetical protein